MAKESNVRVLEVTAADEADKVKTYARIYAAPNLSAADLQLAFNPNSELHLTACMKELEAQAEALRQGDLSRVEGMLLAQAHSLQAIFTRFAHKMAGSEYLNQLKVNSAIALKAQNQCRQTLAALAEIKNPKRATFIKNQATNQQINMNQPDNSQKNSHSKPSNELLSEGSHATMDTAGTAAASAANQAMATVA